MASLVTFTAVEEIVSAAAQTEILAKITQIQNAIPVPGTPEANQGVVGHLDHMLPGTAGQLQEILAALKVAIDAAPTA